MIINTDKKFIHIAIPRTATTCVNIALGNLEHPEPDEHHCTIAEAIKKNPEYKDFYKFLNRLHSRATSWSQGD